MTGAILASLLVAAAVQSPLVLANHIQPPTAGRYVEVEKQRVCQKQLCVAYPLNCLSNNTCTVSLIVTPGSEYYQFEMSASYKGYVAVALAESTSMGNDSVVECVQTNGTVAAYMSENHPTTFKHRNQRLPTAEQVGITLVSSSYSDGVITCQVRRNLTTTVAGKTYDLANGSWVLQVAAGNRVRANNIAHHDFWVETVEETSLNATGVVRNTLSSGDSSGCDGISSALALPLALLTALTQLQGW